MFLPLARSCNTILVGFHGRLAHLETIHSHVHLHLVVGLVSHLWLGGTPSAAHLRVFLLLANVGNSRIKVLPERLNTCLILALVLLLVAQSDLVSFVIDVRCELLLVQVVDYAINGRVFSRCRANMHGRLFGRTESATSFLLAL